MECPYYSLTDEYWWDKSVGRADLEEYIGILTATPLIDRASKVASAGSCFSQNITAYLKKYDFDYYVAEPAPESMDPRISRKFGYGDFSARYGNIYTTRQLRQLLERAVDGVIPVDQFWCSEEGRWFDLLRPRIVRNGFSSREEVSADGVVHLNCVKKMFEEADIFIFTLGMTEAWCSVADGMVYPTCPGCNSPGEFAEDKYYFDNLKVGDVMADLNWIVKRLHEINPEIEIILTVSPVHLQATMAFRPVLEASVYSKSVLRVAAESAVNDFDYVHYFPSYELLTHTCLTNVFFDADRRNVTSAGVDFAMRSFFKLFVGDWVSIAKGGAVLGSQDRVAKNSAGGEKNVICDEDEFYRNLSRKD